MIFKIDEPQSKLTWRTNFCFKSNLFLWVKCFKTKSLMLKNVQKLKSFETVLIISLLKFYIEDLYLLNQKK